MWYIVQQEWVEFTGRRNNTCLCCSSNYMYFFFTRLFGMDFTCVSTREGELIYVVVCIDVIRA